MDSLSQNTPGDNPPHKQCTGCQQQKASSEFGKNKRWEDGLNRYCLLCDRAMQKERSSRNPRRRSSFRRVDDITVEKRCGVCHEWKSISEFSTNGKKRHRWLCKECEAYRHREERAISPSRFKDTALRRIYGLTLAQYNAMLDAQGGVCKSCGKPETAIDKRDGKLLYLAVDHCHRTGVIRGLLCRGCNAALGQLQEDPERMRALAAYIERDVMDLCKPLP